MLSVNKVNQISQTIDMEESTDMEESAVMEESADKPEDIQKKKLNFISKPKLSINLNPRKLNEKVNSDEFKKRLDEVYKNIEDGDNEESNVEDDRDKTYFPFFFW